MRSWPDVSTGRRTRPSFWTSLQDAVDEIEGGEVSLPLAGIADALGAYEPLVRVEARVLDLASYLPTNPDLTGMTDYTTEIQAWATAAAGKLAYAGPGTYGVSGAVTFANSASFVGAGARQTIFKALHADASIILPYANNLHYGYFQFNGNNLADVGVVMTLTNACRYDRILVDKCPGIGLYNKGVQNAVISGVHCTNGGIGYKIDGGAGSCLHLECHQNGNTKHQLLISDDLGNVGAYSYGPHYNTWVGGICEYQGIAGSGSATGGTSATLVNSSASWSTDEWVNAWVTLDPGGASQQGLRVLSNTATTLTVDGTWGVTPSTQTYRLHWASLRVEAGAQNRFIHYQVSPSSSVAAPGEHPCVEIVGNVSAGTSIVADGFRAVGQTAYHIGFELDGPGVTLVSSGAGSSFQGKYGTRIHNETGTRYTGNAPFPIAAPGVTGGEMVYVDGSIWAPPITDQYLTARYISGLTANTYNEIGFVKGDAGWRYYVTASGAIGWGDGTTGSADTNLYRSAANVLKTDDAFQLPGTYLMPLKLGTYCLWVNATSGKLYKKNGTPVSDTDGTIVGTES